MDNIFLFFETLIAYSVLLFLVRIPLTWKRYCKQVALVALLALPINIGGNVFTVAGNATAEKDIYSIFSFYQKAGRDAFTVFGFLYQQAERDAFTFLGLTYQQARRDANFGFGLAVQMAERNAGVGIIALYQRVDEKTRAFGAFSALTKD